LAPEVVKEIGRHSERPRHFARLERDGGPADEPPRPRTGTSFGVPLAKSAFRTVVSAARKYDAHSGSLEAHGVALGLRWLLRCSKRHSRRTVFLIDAQAVLGAVTRGRSSAPTLKREVSFISALLLAGDVRLKAAYVPSEENPADEPSRGVVRRWRSRRGAVPARAGKRLHQAARVPVSCVNHLDKQYAKKASGEDDLRRSIYRLKHCGPESSRQYFKQALASSGSSSRASSSGPSTSFCWA